MRRCGFDRFFAPNLLSIFNKLRFENPRVGGSIPPPGTISAANSLVFVQLLTRARSGRPFYRRSLSQQTVYSTQLTQPEKLKHRYSCSRSTYSLRAFHQGWLQFESKKRRTAR